MQNLVRDKMRKNIIESNNYKRSRYKIFIIREPKIRVIMC